MFRYSKNIPIVIIVHGENSTRNANDRYKAMTLDVNIYGMKITSDSEIATDTVVNFEIDKNICPDFVQGSGMVKWCERQVDSGNFEFGVAFSDVTTSQNRIERLLRL
jgi:hypothetical protein